MNAVVSWGKNIITSALESSSASGAIDVIVVQQQDGKYSCTPFHVRFNKLPHLHPREKTVKLKVNGVDVDLSMKLGAAGEAFFVEKTFDTVSTSYATSPISSPVLGPSARHSNGSSAPRRSTSPPTLSLDEASDPESFDAYQLLSETEAEMSDDPEDSGLRRMTDARPAGDEGGSSPPPQESGWLWSWRWGAMPVRRKSSLSTDGGFEGNDVENPADALDLTVPVALHPPLPPSEPAEGLSERFHSAMDLSALASEAASNEAHASRVTTPVLEEGSDAGELGPDLMGGMPLDARAASAPPSLPMTSIDAPVSSSEASPPSTSRPQTTPLPTTLPPTASNELDLQPPPMRSGLPEAQGGEPSAFFVKSADIRAVEAAAASQATSAAAAARPSGLGSETAVDHFSGVEPRGFASDESGAPQLSLCGNLIANYEPNDERVQAIFEENIVAFETFIGGARQLLLDPRLVVRIHGRLYPFQVAAPYFVAQVVFGQPLQPSTMEAMLLEERREPVASPRAVGSGLSDSQATDVESASSGWSWWRRNSAPADEKEASPRSTPPPTAEHGAAWSDGDLDLGAISEDQIAPSPPRGSMPTSIDPDGAEPSQYQYRKSLFPSHEQLEALGLKTGANTIEFTVESARQGERSVSANIFLWSSDAKIVVTDIDGTITRSSLRGHLIPMLGRDWSHAGVAKLFSDIDRNGYQIVYLTRRPIGQATMTKDYLGSLSQEDATLPQGPVLLSPESLFHHTLRRDRLSHIFKISALRGIRLLFPDSQNPYHAAFGNESGDLVAYRKAGVPRSRVFCVNFDGELQSTNHTFKKSYANMNTLLDEIFPPKTLLGSADFTDLSFWRTPVPIVDSSEEED